MTPSITDQIFALLDEAQEREVSVTPINHGEFESAPIQIQFECSHGVWAKGNNSSLCYTTNKTLADWIVNALKEGSSSRTDLPRYRNALRTAVDTLEHYAGCCDGCTCGDGWNHDGAREALNKILEFLK